MRPRGAVALRWMTAFTSDHSLWLVATLLYAALCSEDTHSKFAQQVLPAWIHTILNPTYYKCID